MSISPKRFPLWKLPTLLVALTVAAGCSTAADESSEAFDTAESSEPMEESFGAEEAVERDADVDAEIVEAAEGESGVSTGSGGAPAAIESDPAADLGRDIIRTADVTVEVDDVVVAGQEAMTIVEGVGGLLFNQSTSTTGTPTSTLVFRVQPADFATVLDRLSGVGVVLSQEVDATDVTDRVVDLESRIATAEISVERLRQFLAEATDLNAIAQVEAQLLERETDLELLRGQLRTIRNQVSLATITLHLTQVVPGPALDVEVTGYAAHDGGAACPGVDELETTEGDPITLCVVIENIGDTHLGQFELGAAPFDLDTRDFTAVDAEPVALAPGESLTFWAETESVLNRDGWVDVRARVVDTEGSDLHIATVDGQAAADLVTREDLSPPSFAEGLAGGWAAMVAFVQVIVFLIGVLLPFVWLPVLGWLLWRWWKPRRAARKQRRMPPPPTVPTPPGSPVAPTTPEQAS